MSYILDALKKSEQQRSDSVQSAIVAPVSPARPEKRRFMLPATLLIAALLAAWGIVQINRDEQHASSGSAPQPVQPSKTAPNSQTAMAPSATSPQPKTAQAAPPVSTHQQTAAPIRPVQPLIRSTPDNAASATASPQTSARPEPAKAVLQAGAAVPVFKPITPTSPVSRAAAPLPDISIPDSDMAINKAQVAPAETDILAISDLPLSVQQSLPSIHIDGHIYDANPAKRMVIINGATYREKQQIAGGLKLEEITPNGVILNFQNHVFHLGVFE